MPTNLKIMRKVDVSALESYALDLDGNPEVIPAADFQHFTKDQRFQFCCEHGIYQLVTYELINFLRKGIGNLPAIEIGCGHGTIGRALGIPFTDSRIQETERLRKIYETLRQPIIPYPDDVEKLEAQEAIEKYKPRVVIGAFVTHLWKPGMEDGFDEGVNEEMLLSKVDRYIFIGNEKTHKHKPIANNTPPDFRKFTLRPTWLYSRADNFGKNVIWIFDRVKVALPVIP